MTVIGILKTGNVYYCIENGNASNNIAHLNFIYDLWFFLKSKIKNVNNEGFACNNTSVHRVALLPSVFVTRRTSDTRRCSSAPGRSGTWACGHHRRWCCSIPSAGWSQCWSELLRRPGWSSSSGHRMRTGSTEPLWGGTKRETGDPPVDGNKAVQTHQFWLLSACADAFHKQDKHGHRGVQSCPTRQKMLPPKESLIPGGRLICLVGQKSQLEWSPPGLGLNSSTPVTVTMDFI